MSGVERLPDRIFFLLFSRHMEETCRVLSTCKAVSNMRDVFAWVLSERMNRGHRVLPAALMLSRGGMDTPSGFLLLWPSHTCSRRDTKRELAHVAEKMRQCRTQQESLLRQTQVSTATWAELYKRYHSLSRSLCVQVAVFVTLNATTQDRHDVGGLLPRRFEVDDLVEAFRVFDRAFLTRVGRDVLFLLQKPIDVSKVRMSARLERRCCAR